MDKKDLFKLLDNITGNEPEPNEPTFTKHDRILIIDGLNLFLRNFAVLSYVNQEWSSYWGSWRVFTIVRILNKSK
jgi:hypothetical protein